MRTIGIRAEPSSITFCIFDTLQNEIIDIDQIHIPNALTIPEGLKYIRVNLLDILREYNIEHAGIRITESNSRTLKIDRLRIEGVILETFASSTLKKYFCGQISSISRLLNFDRENFKKFIDGTLIYEGIENWETLSKIEREACLASLGAMHA